MELGKQESKRGAAVSGRENASKAVLGAWLSRPRVTGLGIPLCGEAG